MSVLSAVWPGIARALTEPPQWGDRPPSFFLLAALAPALCARTVEKVTAGDSALALVAREKGRATVPGCSCSGSTNSAGELLWRFGEERERPPLRLRPGQACLAPACLSFPIAGPALPSAGAHGLVGTAVAGVGVGGYLIIRWLMGRPGTSTLRVFAVRRLVAGQAIGPSLWRPSGKALPGLALAARSVAQ